MLAEFESEWYAGVVEPARFEELDFQLRERSDEESFSDDVDR